MTALITILLALWLTATIVWAVTRLRGKNPLSQVAGTVDRKANLNDQLKAAQDRYSETIRGSTSADPMQLLTEEQIKARQDDAVARFKDAQNNPSEPTPVKLLTPSPFSSLPPTVTDVQPSGRTVSPYEAPQTFTDRQKDLLDLRNQTLEIERERDRLINEMRQKNISTESAEQ